MKISLLGPVSIETQGLLIPVGSMRVRSLLAILALNAGRTVSSAHLVEEIWEVDNLRNARNALQAAIARLRKVLAQPGDDEGPTLRTEPAGYRLEIDPELVDALLFVRIVSSNRDLLEANPAQALERYNQALGLWRGTPLEDVPDDGVLRAERRRLDETRAEIYELRAHARISSGQTVGAVAELRHLVGIYPYRERLHELLIIALYQGGQQSESLLAFRELRMHLDSEFGIEPSDRLRLLHDSILARRELPPIEVASSL